MVHGGLGPTLFSAITLNVYSLPSNSLLTLYSVVLASVRPALTNAPPLRLFSTVYPCTRSPPSDFGVSQAIMM